MDRGEFDQLWTLPLEEFTRVRDDLSRRAREEGDQEASKEIKAVRKPTVAAWAVNQLARRRREDIRRLVGLGEVMRKAQQEAFGGGGREALRTATAERRRLVDQLVDDAAALLSQAGYGSSRSVLDKVSDTLVAAASDEEIARLVGEGVLQRETVPPSGLDDLASLMTAGPAPRSSSPRTATSKRPTERAKRADELARRLEEEAAEAETRAAGLRSEADRLARVAEKAAKAAEREEKLAGQARERADRARQEADATEDDED